MGLFSDDPDETHYFVDLKNQKLIIGKIQDHSQVEFFNIEPSISKKLSQFILS